MTAGSKGGHSAGMQTWLEVSDWLQELGQRIGPEECPLPPVGRRRLRALELESRRKVDVLLQFVAQGNSPPMTDLEAFWLQVRLGEGARLCLLLHTARGQRPGPLWKEDVLDWMIYGWAVCLAENWVGGAKVR